MLFLYMDNTLRARTIIISEKGKFISNVLTFIDTVM